MLDHSHSDTASHRHRQRQREREVATIERFTKKERECERWTERVKKRQIESLDWPQSFRHSMT